MSLSSPRIPELLAPAGSPDALRAAVAAGADAVYLGMGELNARRSADNFNHETLAEACRFAHLRGSKVYLTVNVVVLDSEMRQALDLIASAWTLGVDAIIVQDLGLLRACRLVMPDVRVHASTQISAHSSDTVRVLIARGASRVTLARETSFAEITELASIASSLGAEVESFAHGALCVCYSGQCLLSSLIGGRSANRGMCAQPCRLPYELVDAAGATLSDMGAHLLSPKDLASVTALPQLVGTGTASLKLEGRMKSPEYVALVTGVYRAALDRLRDNPDAFEVRDGELAVLSEAFSRGFTLAYLAGERGNEMMSYRRPNNRGIFAGRIVAMEGMRASIAFETAMDADDTIEVWTGRGRFAQPLGPIEYAGHSQRVVPAGTRATVSLTESAGVGDRVFRVRNAQLLSAARRTFSDPSRPKVALGFSVRIVVGAPLEVTVRDAAGICGQAQGEVVEPARTKAVTTGEVVEHIGRLGGTPFEASDWEVDLSPDAGVGFSALHTVRREALNDYEKKVLRCWADREVVVAQTPPLPRADAHRGSVVLVASALSVEAAQACLEAGADEVHVPASELLGQAIPEGVVPVVNRICHDQECPGYLDVARGAGRCVAGNLGSLWRLAQEGVVTSAHWSLNALNAHAVAELAEMGAGSVWLSPELAATQVSAVAQAACVPVGIAVAGHQELMVTEHCVLMSEGPCAQDCLNCVRRRSKRFLRDRKGYEFPVITDSAGRTHLYNAVPLDLTASLEEILVMPISALRLDLEVLSAEEAASEVARVRSALRSTQAGSPVGKPAHSVTSGHFYRGIR